MPTYYSYGMRLTDVRAAEIIRKAFPKWHMRLFRSRRKCWSSVHTVCDALMHARNKCRNESLDECIKWAYGIDRRKRGW